VPTSYFSATFDESIDLLRALCGDGLRLVLGSPVHDPVREHAAIDDALVAALRASPACFLSGDFTRRSVVSRVLAGTRCIDALAEGPLLELLLPREMVVEGEPTLLLGDLSRQSRYRDPSGGWVPASPELKRAYTRALRRVRSFTSVDPRLAFPIGPEALRRFSAGQAMVQQRFVGVAATDPSWRVQAS
jgi:hypothetical protein